MPSTETVLEMPTVYNLMEYYIDVLKQIGRETAHKLVTIHCMLPVGSNHQSHDNHRPNRNHLTNKYCSPIAPQQAS